MTDKLKKRMSVLKTEQVSFLKQINEKTPETQAVDPSKPDVTYEIDHVYGFSGDRVGSCLYFGKKNDEIVFPTAALGVKQNLSSQEQKYFGGGEKEKDEDKYVASWPAHQDDITSLDIAGNDARNIICSGESGKMSTVHIWDSDAMKSIANFQLGATAKGVAAVAISPCQRYVAAVDSSNDHTMYIYNVQKKKMLLTLSAGGDSIHSIKWSKKPNDLRFVAVTSRALQFWNPADASKRLFKNGTFGQKFQQTKMSCATYDDDGVCYSGGANGGVYLWDQKQDLGMVLKAHAGECTAVACNQGTLVSAGADDMISVFSANQGEYEYLRQIHLKQKSFASCIDVLDGKILVGNDNGKIQTVMTDGTDLQTVASSHNSGEAWGLEVIGGKGTFLTCGDDNQMFEVNIKDKKVVREAKIWTMDQNEGKPYELGKGKKNTASTQSKFPVHMQARGITYCARHGHIAVSNNYGDVFIVDYNDWSKRITTILKAREWCETLAYSPDGNFLAIGGHDDTIYIYKISEDGQTYGHHYTVSFVHSSAILGMDWTRDSRYLRAVDQAYAKQVYDVQECEQVKDGQTTMVDPMLWATQTCKLGWDVNGVYRQGMDGTDINSVDASSDRQLLAASDDSGTLTVFRYPAVSNFHECVRLTGHSEHLPRVRFYEGDPKQRYIITSGGNDRTYIQWKEVPRKNE